MAQPKSAGGGDDEADTTLRRDTVLTKVFVGGLAWETRKEGLRGYFARFGEILEAVVIFDKSTGRSKGYGFVTFREAEAAMRACDDPYPVIDGRRGNCNLAYLGAHRSKLAHLSYLQSYNAGDVHGGSNMNRRAMKAAAIAAAGGDGASFVDHGLQQGFPAYNMYEYPPYFSEYGFQHMTFYNLYGRAAGASQFQGCNADGGAAAAVPAPEGMTLADPTGFYNPYYDPVSPNAAHGMMPYPQMYQFPAVGETPECNPTSKSSLHQFVGAAPFEPKRGGQEAGTTKSLPAPAQSAPSTPQFQSSLVSSKPAAAPVQNKPAETPAEKKPAATQGQKNPTTATQAQKKPTTAQDQKKPLA